jgi:Myb/SANT-like DNA-binding protein
VAFTMATRTARYGNVSNAQSQSNSQSNSLRPTPDPTLDPTLDTSVDASLDTSSNLDVIDNQIPLVISTRIPKKEKKVNLIWTDIMEETLFNGLLEQDHNGKRADMGFKTEAWAIVQDAVQEVYLGYLVIEVSQLKSKESNYKALYKDWKWLKEQSGFGQDPTTGAITASLQAWSDIIKVYFYFFCIYRYLLTIKDSQILWMA